MRMGSPMGMVFTMGMGSTMGMASPIGSALGIENVDLCLGESDSWLIQHPTVAPGESPWVYPSSYCSKKERTDY